VESGDEVFGTCLPGEAPTSRVKTVALDIRDRAACAQIVQEFRPEIIFHLAGISFVPEAEKDFDRALDINVGGTYNMFRACQDLNLPATVVFISSAEIYGKVRPEDLPLRETLLSKPQTNYSLSKIMGESICHRFALDGVVRPVVIRAFNHIGVGQNNVFVCSSFAEQLAAIAKKKAPPVIRVGNLEAKRDFVDVRDIARGYRLAALKGSGTYNLCSGKSYSIRDILDTLIEISGVKVTIECDPTRMRPSDVPEIRGSFDKAKCELGWEPHHSLRETLKAVYDQYYSQP
jgi:GDP-4-dehydro-6-deoxy-D-mannose reductase